MEKTLGVKRVFSVFGKTGVLRFVSFGVFVRERKERYYLHLVYARFVMAFACFCFCFNERLVVESGFEKVVVFATPAAYGGRHHRTNMAG